MYLPGGIWTGEVHQYTDGFYYTGATHTDSSSKLSYNSVDDTYIIDTIHWTGESHIHEEYYFTGTDHDDGSVPLTRSGVPVAETTEIDDETLGILAASIVPSFTPDGLTPEDYNCSLGEDVEWVRRMPLSGEGFLIKIEQSFTSENL